MLGVFSHTASVEKHHVGRVEDWRHFIASLLQKALDDFGVVPVHLAAEGHDMGELYVLLSGHKTIWIATKSIPRYRVSLQEYPNTHGKKAKTESGNRSSIGMGV